MSSPRGSNGGSEKNSLRKAGTYHFSNGSSFSSSQDLFSSAASSPALFHSARSNSPPPPDTFLIFKRMLPHEGTAMLSKHGWVPGSFLIRESSTAGMITIDFVDTETSSREHIRLQFQIDGKGGYHWVIIGGAHIEEAVKNYNNHSARFLNAENFNQPAIKESLFALLANMKFLNLSKIVCSDKKDAAADFGYTYTDLESYLHTSQELQSSSLARSR